MLRKHLVAFAEICLDVRAFWVEKKMTMKEVVEIEKVVKVLVVEVGKATVVVESVVAVAVVVVVDVVVVD